MSPPAPSLLTIHPTPSPLHPPTDYDVVVAMYDAREARALLYYQLGKRDLALAELERLSKEVAGTASVHAALAAVLYR